MKRIVLIIIIFLGIIGISIYFINDNSPKSVNTFKSSEEIQPTGYNSLAVMLENEDGQYVLTDTDTWPTDGYVFNPDLSKCENGGTLSWNDGKITLKTNGSDKCYAYFDKTHPSSFTMDVMEPDFYINCSVQVSYDNGEKWEDITLSTEKGHVTSFNEGVMLRVNRTTENYNWCAIKICEEPSCPLTDSGNASCFDYPIRSFRDGDGRNDYIVKGGNAYTYSLSYCSCLTGDNDIWVEEKKKRRKKKVNELKKGDLILVYDEDKKKIVIEKIKDIVINKINIIYKIYLNDGSVINCSANHLFIAKDFGAITAQEIKKGYELLDALGNYQKIENIEIENDEEGVEVYSIIIEKKGKKYFILNKCLIVTLSFAFDMLTASALPCA